MVERGIIVGVMDTASGSLGILYSEARNSFYGLSKTIVSSRVSVSVIELAMADVFTNATILTHWGAALYICMYAVRREASVELMPDLNNYRQ